MFLRCEECGKLYSYEANDGFCPKCGCYNNISHQAAARLEAEDHRRLTARLARERDKSLCSSDHEENPGEYGPECMEEPPARPGALPHTETGARERQKTAGGFRARWLGILFIIILLLQLLSALLANH